MTNRLSGKCAVITGGGRGIGKSIALAFAQEGARCVITSRHIEDLVATVIERMGNVKKIILIEDYAKGIDSKNIEVVLVGQYLNFEYISQLEEKIEKLIKRKVSFYLASKFLSDKPHIVIFNKDEK